MGETMESVVWRFHERGLSTEIISDKSGMPGEFIESVIKEHAESAQASGG
jgi:hypothetical protein